MRGCTYNGRFQHNGGNAGYYHFIDHFTGTAAVDTNHWVQNVGGGTAALVANGSGGILQLTFAGTGYLDMRFATNNYYRASNPRLKARVQAHVAATDKLMCGFLNGTAAGGGTTDGFIITYDFATYGANWQLDVVNNSVDNMVDTGVPFAIDTWTTVEVWTTGAVGSQVFHAKVGNTEVTYSALQPRAVNVKPVLWGFATNGAGGINLWDYIAVGADFSAVDV